ncbi:MAG: response regulator [bacterium]
MSQKIFILDDDENSCQLVKQVLSKAGFEVMAQTKAIGATNSIKAFHPDLVLLDVMMPALSGDNLVEIIQRLIKPSPRIVYYSNKSEHELRELVEKTGVDGYICKVDGPNSLVSKVKGML